MSVTLLNVPARLRAIAARRRHHLALIDETGRVSYGEMIDAMDGVAATLRRSGIEPGDRVGIAMEPSSAYVTFVLGCLAAGIVPAPVNTRLTSGEAKRFLDTIEPRFILADDGFADLAEGTGYETIVLDAPQRSAPLVERLGQYGAAPSAIAPAAEDAPAIIFATGGTTGSPKGVFYDHRGMWLWMNTSAATNPGDRFDLELFFAPFFHIALGTNLISRLFAGGAVWILRKFDAGRALIAIEKGATRITGAPTMFAMLRDHPSFENTRRTGMKAIRLGSMAANPDFVLEVMRHYPEATIRTGYGATEFGPLIGVEHQDLVAGRTTGIGRPHPGAEVTIMRPDGSEADIGEVGEFVVRATWQSRGYWGRPDETAATYRPEGIHMGDLGFVDEDGWFTISGRSKEMIISGGENVFPAEVEDVLRTHPDVTDVIVYGMPDEQWGERVEIAAIPRSGAQVELEDLREYGRSHLAGYKLPKTMRLIDEVPLTTVQKPDRRAAREQALQQLETTTG